MGGSFNPAHDGHAMVAQLAIKRLRLHRVWWLVSSQNPLKTLAEMSPLEKRVAQAQTIAKHPRIEVSALEAKLGTQYTVDTIQTLSKRFTRTRFVWIMGADNMAQFHAWKDWQTISKTVGIAVFDRPSYSLKALSSQTARRFARFRLSERKGKVITKCRPPVWIFNHTRRNPVSATKLRAKSSLSR